MALSMLKLADLPAATRGVAAATEPKVTITATGQFRFNKLAAEAFKGTHIQLGWDAKTRVLGFFGTSDPKEGGVSFENKADKKGALYLSGSRVCRLIGWDYNFSGNFSTDATMDAEKQKVTITLPDPQPPAPPKKERKPRKAKGESAQPAAPEAKQVDDDISLDVE